MSAFKQESSSAASPAPQSACFDAFDLDRYIDYEQTTYPSPSVSPTASALQPGATPSSLTIESNRTIHPSQSSSQQVFPGPSHQYGQYQQFAVLPVGGVASTIAVNQASSLSFGRSFGASPIDGYFPGGSTDFDFSTPPSHNPSFSASSDMDMDMDFSAGAFFPATDLQSPNTDFVDPNAISGNEDMTSTTTPTQSNVGRLWPGMHQQQAKAQAQAQAEQQKQQQMMTQQPRNLPNQQPLPPAPRNTKAGPHSAPDPIVEERISRLLNQMRQSSVASSHDDDAATPNANGLLPHIARMRKEEEDMDEDERLLASEEGKKLSSKERRQLRNKVSARAFRSRRKEYIGQLEGEVAVKAKEADDLRAQNETLIAENTRLTDLTRMLLSSAAFSSFLSEMSNDKQSTASNAVPTPASSTASTSAPRTRTTESRPNMRKDINPRHATPQQIQRQQQSGPQVGMAMVPETYMDFSNFEPRNNIWTGSMDLGFNNAQVFTVVDLPLGPAVDQIDSGLLSGKTSNLFSKHISSEEGKDQAPAIERMPSIPLLQEDKVVTPQQPVQPIEDVHIDESDPSFALFADCATVPRLSTLETHEQLFGHIQPEKVFARVDLVIEDATSDGQVSAAAMGRFERICSSIEGAFQRIEAVTSHL